MTVEAKGSVVVRGRVSDGDRVVSVESVWGRGGRERGVSGRGAELGAKGGELRGTTHVLTC